MAGRQGGSSLPEALIAFLVLSAGMVVVARLQTHLHANAEIARHRSEAVHLAREELEAMRVLAAPDAASGVRTFADLASASRTVADSVDFHSNTQYRIDRRIDPADTAALKAVTVTVDWADRRDEPRQVGLPSFIGGTPPGFSGALSAQASPRAIAVLRGRSPAIPVGALDRRDGSSVYTPAGATTALVFDNASGQVIARCDADDPDPRHCTPIQALLLSGWIRFALGDAPEPALANDPALRLAVVLTLRDAAAGDSTDCLVDMQERTVAYHCAIVSAGGSWSGRTQLVPQGWVIGNRPTEFRVCRYSADRDDTGAIDANIEHPGEYRRVDGPLMQQNFLVVRGDRDCPQPVPIAGAHADFRTVLHQT